MRYPGAGRSRPHTTVMPDAVEGEGDDADTLGVPIAAQQRPFQFAATFPGDPAAVPVARRRLHNLMCKSGFSEIADALTQGAQELMANAATHGCCGQAAAEFTVTATCRRGRMRLEVQDPSPDRPRLREATDDETGGRGLILVAAFSDRWGVEDGPANGKTVWMELDCTNGEVES